MFLLANEIYVSLAEAVGAIAPIGDSQIRETLKKYGQDTVVEVAETCQLALQRISWFEKNCDNDCVSPYNSVDPTPPSQEEDVTRLRAILLDENESLFERYRAMFALRNLNSDASISALCDGNVSN